MRLILAIWLCLSSVDQFAAAFTTAIVEDYTEADYPQQRLIDLGLKVRTSSMA